jgi:hypothetical protein
VTTLFSSSTCRHDNLRGIYGDEILHLGFARSICLDCGRLFRDLPYTRLVQIGDHRYSEAMTYQTSGYGDDGDCGDLIDLVEVVPPSSSKGYEFYGQVSLPHRCNDWVIGRGPRQDVLARIDRMIADLHAAKSAVLAWER